MKIVKYSDRIFPTQSGGEWLYKGGLDNFYGDLYRAINLFSDTSSPSERYQLELYDQIPIEQLGSTPLILKTLQTLIAIHSSKRALEVGTFIGLSALAMAEALPADGKVVVIEKFDKFAEIAKRNFAQNGYAEKIELILGDAAVELTKLQAADPFDFIFIDGHKELYAQYLEQSIPLLDSKGIIVVDDVLFDGDALNPEPQTEKGLGCKKCLEQSLNYTQFTKLLLPIGSGMLILIKK